MLENVTWRKPTLELQGTFSRMDQEFFPGRKGVQEIFRFARSGGGGSEPYIR